MELINVTGGLAGVNDNFDAGVITWKFNSNNTITVTNNNTNNNLNDILETGIYSYNINQNPTSSLCNQTITIGDVNYGCFTSSSNELNIYYDYADGFNLKFIQ